MEILFRKIQWPRCSRQLQLAVLLLFASLPMQALAESKALRLVDTLDKSPHTESIAESSGTVRNYEIGLGPLQKIGGSWVFETSERQSGALSRQTWQVLNGYTSLDLLNEFTSALDTLQDATLLYACDGRRCGHGAQWASKIFEERLLYGRQDLQRYRVYKIEQASAEGETVRNPEQSAEGVERESARLVVYASARSESRQYIHIDVLRIQPVSSTLLM